VARDQVWQTACSYCVLIVFSLCLQQVEWLEKKYGQQLGVESAKLLQIYRLLAGQVDDVLE
jgi:hypothetical protein